MEDPESVNKQQNALVMAARITEYEMGNGNEQTWHNAFMKYKLYKDTRNVFNHYYMMCEYPLLFLLSRTISCERKTTF